MDNSARWILVAVLVVHGLIHFLGVAKGFGLASAPQLKEPISAGMAVVWLSGGVLVLATAAMIIAAAPSWWWGFALLAALVSQITIITSWSDAKVGTIVNIILLVVAAYGFLAGGPFSFSAQWTAQADAALEQQADVVSPVLTEADLESLPDPLADYIRVSGAVGKPRTTNFSADFHGRIRSAPDTAWMSFTGKQLNTYGENPQRLFLMHARRSGMPVEVLHLFHDATATMEVKLLAAILIVDAKGPEMNRAETVTVFQEMVALAPGAIIDAPVRWTAVDEHRVHGVYTLGQHSVSATLVFDDRHDLVDFISRDRLRASDDGMSFTPQEWSTPLLEHRDVDGRRVLTVGEARWQSPGFQRLFTYLEIHLDAISFDVVASGSTSRSESTAASLVGGP